MSFEARTAHAVQLEQAFIEVFNRQISTHRIVKSGIEASDLHEFHAKIRHCQDQTSQFIRFLPDAVLLSLEERREDTTLVEFKNAATGVREQWFMGKLQRGCPDMVPPFETKADVYNVEYDALQIYKGLHSIGVRVVLVAYGNWVEKYPLRAQFVEHIAICGDEFNPNTGIGSQGSGTNIANVNFASFRPMVEFFDRNFNMAESQLKTIEGEVVRNLTAQKSR